MAAMLSRKQLTATMSSIYTAIPIWCKIEAAIDGVKTALTELEENAHIACPHDEDLAGWMQFDMGKEFTVHKARDILGANANGIFKTSLSFLSCFRLIILHR